MKELEELREIFLNDVDEETKEENLEQINEWERKIVESEALIEWQQHDISRSIVQKLKETVKEIAVSLGTNRSLSEEQRVSLWAKQDACFYLLSLLAEDSQEMRSVVEAEIKRALNATT